MANIKVKTQDGWQSLPLITAINDSQISNKTTWSSQKIQQELTPPLLDTTNDSSPIKSLDLSMSDLTYLSNVDNGTYIVTTSGKLRNNETNNAELILSVGAFVIKNSSNNAIVITGYHIIRFDQSVTTNDISNQSCFYNTNTEVLALVNNLDVCIDEQTYGDGESGYRKYRNGNLEQWGVVNKNSYSDAETEFTLHQTYKNTNYSVFVEIREQGNYYHYVIPSANNKFKVRFNDQWSATKAVTFQWRSIGRWK